MEETMEPMTRGYAVPLAARYVLEDPELRTAISDAMRDELMSVADSKPAVWVPRQEVVRIWSIVEQVSKDEESAYRNLVRGGETVAQQAISTFLKLLLRVLSPKQFARKFPDIWAHEHKGGYVEAVLDGDNPAMLITIHDVETFPHVGPVAVGFAGTALRALGLKDLKIRDVTWTRAKPNPKDVRIEISWK
jgi:hypothetical protein